MCKSVSKCLAFAAKCIVQIHCLVEIHGFLKGLLDDVRLNVWRDHVHQSCKYITVLKSVAFRRDMHSVNRLRC